MCLAAAGAVMRARRLCSVALIALVGACFDIGGSSTTDPGPETRRRPVTHRVASPDCIRLYTRCYSACESDEANTDIGEMSPLRVPNEPRIAECQTNCGRLYGCMPWDVGVLTGEPCRWSDDEYECNFFVCTFAATECLLDCGNVFRTTNPRQLLQDQCVDRCYDHYGCRPRPSDACTPLPEGYVYCGCPEEHGVECHSMDHELCSF